MQRSDLELLVRAHQAEVFRYLRYLGADAAEAEDLVQETFLAALGAEPQAPADDLRGRSAWLRGIARNQFLMHCRRARTSPVRADSESLRRSEEAWSTRFLRDGDGFDYVEALRRCVDSLGENQRHAIDLRYVEKASRTEMASALKMSGDGVKSLLRRIRTALAECVKRNLEAERT